MILGIQDFGHFKKKFSKINMIFDELNFIFKDDGLYIKETDISNDNFIYLHLKRDYFDEFDFCENASYKVNLFNFYQCLKTLSVKDKLYLKFSDTSLKISSEKKKKVQSYYIDIIKNGEIMLESDFNYYLDYNNILEINYSRENKIEDMGDFLFNNISFEVKDGKLFLETKNDDIQVIKELNNIHFLKSTDYSVKSIHKFKSIQSIFSFLSLGHKHTLSINERSPIKIEIVGKDFVMVLITSNICGS